MFNHLLVNIRTFSQKKELEILMRFTNVNSLPGFTNEIILKMARKGKARVRNDSNSETQNNQTPNQVDDENVEINLDCSLPSSTRASNEICSSSAPPNKRHRKVNVRGKAKGVKSGEGIEVEIYDNSTKVIRIKLIDHNLKSFILLAEFRWPSIGVTWLKRQGQS
ncbi:uncharacterized protein LOC120251870 [Dioscorea cayenensis subsp. rotundata]|uniref:Uncharacterized protein LOC120251870 n=1 Tax=Dioscorea cayennensis subsp. rotundata TaxID=55577 RepID=A0AB40ANN6_DIOCR|nr:uncharacterized protein LOC120251870 [Dioscorea cayenensis subsp. rotundata]